MADNKKILLNTIGSKEDNIKAISKLMYARPLAKQQISETETQSSQNVNSTQDLLNQTVEKVSELQKQNPNLTPEITVRTKTGQTVSVPFEAIKNSDIVKEYDKLAPSEPTPVDRKIENAKKIGALVSAIGSNLFNRLGAIANLTANFNAAPATTSKPYIQEYFASKQQNDLLDRQAKMLNEQQRRAFEQQKLNLMSNLWTAANKQMKGDDVTIKLKGKDDKKGKSEKSYNNPVVTIGGYSIPINWSSGINDLLKTNAREIYDKIINEKGLLKDIAGNPIVSNPNVLTDFYNDVMNEVYKRNPRLYQAVINEARNKYSEGKEKGYILPSPFIYNPNPNNPTVKLR